jgi:hypothetical protein
MLPRLELGYFLYSLSNSVESVIWQIQKKTWIADRIYVLAQWTEKIGTTVD